VTDTPDPAAERAFLYDGTSVLDLNTLLDGSGDGWVLHAANDVNDAGQIVGYGTHNVTAEFEARWFCADDAGGTRQPG